MPRRLDQAIKAQREAAKAAAKAQREAAKAAVKAEREAAKLAKKIANAVFKKHVKRKTPKKKLDTITRLMDNASSALPNDLLRRLYTECIRLKNDDNRAALMASLKQDILDFSRLEYVDESLVRDFDFPVLGRVHLVLDAWKGTKTKKAVMITAGNDSDANSVVYGAIFFNRENDDAWNASAVSFGSTAGASLAFESLRDLLDDVAKSVVAAYNASRKQTFDRRRMDPEVVRAKVSEIGLEAAAAHFGISVYRLNKLADM